jgi:L,D-transpeptidase ErfK/SrfK
MRGLGARFGIDIAALAADNGLATDARLAPGQTLRIDNRHIVPAQTLTAILTINVPQRMLFHAGARGVVEAFPVAVGRPDWRTPTGLFAVTTMRRNPAWHVPDSIRAESRKQGRELPRVVPAGPANPLGAHWIGLGGGVGVHGTNAPSSIFRVATHGCIRLHPDDAARVFSAVVVGSPVHVVYEPVLLAETEDGVYLEVHRDIYGRLTDRPERVARALARAAGIAERVNWTLADAVVAARHGVARRVDAVGREEE